MYYHVQINYFNSDSGEMTLLSECNIQDIDDLKERVINPYVFGHSFKFCGIDLVLASVHQFRAYESEEAISDSLQSVRFDVLDSVMKDVTKEIMERIKWNTSACTSG